MKAAIVDIDGTLADCRHRIHHVRHGKRNWPAFFEGISDDTCIEPVRDIATSLIRDGVAIILCSGRGNDYRSKTVEWLGKHKVPFTALYMRAAEDYRQDHIVKEELLAKIREDGYEPFVVIDDRQSVVDMWRKNGLICLQCAPSDFDIPHTARLTLMVGPSGAGKSTLLKNAYSEFAHQIISSDKIRFDLCGNIQDQSKNDQVFEALYEIARARLKHGLAVIIDATNIRRKDRMNAAKLVPEACEVNYIVVNRSMEEKRRDAGWRADVKGKDGEPFDLIAKHEEVFKMNLKDIMKGDGLPNVIVHDLR